MAKKQSETNETNTRESRRDVLIRRKAERENRQVAIIMGSVIGALVLVLITALIIEYGVRPRQAVATVNGESISLRDWQERVRYQRAQTIVQIEQLTETFDGDIGRVQQFYGQQIFSLNDPAQVGQAVLDRMVDEALIIQEAQSRGISVSEAEIDAFIEETFGYTGGESPTPVPTATETVVPTPSITPIPTAVITEVVPTATPFPTPTLGPTSTPRPTATPVSFEEFQSRVNETLERLGEKGVDETIFREVLRAQLYEDQLREVLAEEDEVATEGPHASFFAIFAETQEEADEVLADIQATDFLSVWNNIRSAPPPTSPEDQPTIIANETLSRNRASLETTFPVNLLDVVFDGPLATTSDVIVAPDANAVDRFVIVYVSGRDVLDFSEAQINAAQQTNLEEWLAEASIGSVELTELWRNRIPANPRLDADFLAPQPTFTVPAGLPGGLPGQ